MSKDEIKNEALQQDEQSVEQLEEAQVIDEVLTLKEEMQKLTQALEDAEQALAEAKEKELRAYAEIENIRRRSEKDVQSAHKFALEKFANALLPVIDSMEKATEQNLESAEAKAMAEGVELTMKMFIDVVGKFGLQQLDPLDQPFDPNLHEAMAMQPNPEKQDNTVAMVFQKGYVLNERVIRPARVIVVKNM